MFDFTDPNHEFTPSDGVLGVLKRSLVTGDYSDVEVKAFNDIYKLHKIVLAGSGFFERAFQWSEEDNQPSVIELGDVEFSKDAFELCIGVLYGYKNETTLRERAIDVMVTAQYLDISHIVETCIDWLVEDVTIETVGELIPFSVHHSYQRLTDTCVALLAMSGWEAGAKTWGNVPVNIIANIFKSNWLFVPSEWHRCLFLLELIQIHNNDETLQQVLNQDIMYCHFSHDQLLLLSSMTTLIDHVTLKSALWESVQLQQFIVSNKNFTSKNKWSIPTKDETLSGLVPDLIPKGGVNQTEIPPFRFSVAFVNVSNLPPNKRIYSKTFWYLGSYWNVYLQKSQLPSTGQYQIGIYLHRANSSTISNILQENVPEDSCVTGFNCGANSSKNGIQNEDIFAKVNGLVDSLQADMSNLKLNDSSKITIPYEDKRDELNVYFSFYTPSRLNKPEITSFFSVPNRFSLNQSWGWKSNNLCQFTPDGHFLPDDDDILRFIIVLGQ